MDRDTRSRNLNTGIYNNAVNNRKVIRNATHEELQIGNGSDVRQARLNQKRRKPQPPANQSAKEMVSDKPVEKRKVAAQGQATTQSKTSMQGKQATKKKTVAQGKPAMQSQNKPTLQNSSLAKNGSQKHSDNQNMPSRPVQSQAKSRPGQQPKPADNRTQNRVVPNQPAMNQQTLSSGGASSGSSMLKSALLGQSSASSAPMNTQAKMLKQPTTKKAKLRELPSKQASKGNEGGVIKLDDQLSVGQNKAESMTLSQPVPERVVDVNNSVAPKKKTKKTVKKKVIKSAKGNKAVLAKDTSEEEIYSEDGAKVVKKKVTKKVASKEPSYVEKNLAEIEKALGLNDSENPGSPLGKKTGYKSPFDHKSSFDKNRQNPAVMDAQTKKLLEYVLLGFEAIVLIIVISVCVGFYQKMQNKEFDLSEAGVENYADTSYEANDYQDSYGEYDLGNEDDSLDGTNEAPAQSYAGMSPVDVDNNDFSLFCQNVSVQLDIDGNPAALIYFSFTNKTSTPMSMSEVFPPSITQNGEVCETFASLEEYPEEFYNKDAQIADGQTLYCCYAVALKDAISPISLTIHDNYDSFQDVGTTEIQIQ